MAKKLNKYIRGRRIETMDEFVREIKKNGFIFMNHKPVHSAFLASMHFCTVLGTLELRAEGRGFFYAVDTRPINAIIRFARAIGISIKKKS